VLYIIMLGANKVQILACGNCRTLNLVDVCTECGRAFVITKTRVEAGTRQYADTALSELPDSIIQPCDYCLSKRNNEPIPERLSKGLRQRTCPACHSEFLSAHGLKK
jgi:hypothetical protein